MVPVILFALLLLNPVLALASVGDGGGGGQGDSDGIPGQKPLHFVSANIINGGNLQNAANVPLNASFKLSFDKNVVNSLVWVNNSKCFSLYTGGTKVSIEVTKIDDTVDFSSRQFVFVKPANSLKAGTNYTLKVSQDLRAKNGVSILGGTTGGKGVSISFKTLGSATKPSVQSQTTTKKATTTTSTATSSTSKTTTPKQQGSSTQAAKQTTTAQTAAKQNVTAANQAVTTPGSVSKAAYSTAGSTEAKDVKQGVYSEKTKQNKPAAKQAKASPINWVGVIGAVLIIGWVITEVIIKKRKLRK